MLYRFRQRILVAGDATRARIAPTGDATPFESHDVGAFDEAEQADLMAKAVATMHAGLNLAVGPMLRVGLFRRGVRPDRLVIVAHRLVVDTRSLHILVEDLDRALTQLRDGGPLQLPAKTTSWQAWTRRLTRYGQGEEVQSQGRYWADVVGAGTGRLPSDRTPAEGADTVESASVVTTALDSEETATLLGMPKKLDCGLENLLLAGMGRVLASWTGHDRHVVNLVTDGRDAAVEEVDLTRTVGAFEFAHPVLLPCPADGDPAEAARSVKTQLQSVPFGGVGWQLSGHGVQERGHPPVDLAFSTHIAPQLPEGSSFVSVDVDNDDYPGNLRRHPLEVDVALSGDRLAVRWTFSDERHQAETIGRLAERFLAELRLLIELGGDSSLIVQTPEDFPLAKLDQEQLSQLLIRL